ncbi:rod shape-determining protein MreC [Desulfonauticus submarinus]
MGSTGLEIVGVGLRPIDYIFDQVEDFWNSYIYLVGVKQENDLLKKDLERLQVENLALKNKLTYLHQFFTIFKLRPFPQYKYTGARIIGKKIGPSGLLQSIIIDKGYNDGLKKDLAVFSPKGLIGKIQKLSPHSALILLVIDPNSRVAVISEQSKVPGIIRGEGYGNHGILLYVPRSSRLKKGELLLTSGTDEMFPPGLPVARVENIIDSELSLFLKIKVSFEVDPYLQNVVLVMLK